MRTINEIAERCREETEDLFGFTLEVLVPYLPFAAAREFLKPEVTADEWQPQPLDRDRIIAEMSEYMAFAWEKAEDHRGLSASRSVCKMQAWLWLLGDESLLAFAEDDANYPSYGAPILAAISRAYGFPVPEEERVARMAQGLPCRLGCDEGCR